MQTVFDPMFIAVYNLFYTSLPVLALGIFDQDVNDVNSLKYPKLYTPGHLNLLFNKGEFFKAAMHGCLTSFILFFIAYGAFFFSFSGFFVFFLSITPNHPPHPPHPHSHLFQPFSHWPWTNPRRIALVAILVADQCNRWRATRLPFSTSHSFQHLVSLPV